MNRARGRRRPVTVATVGILAVALVAAGATGAAVLLREDPPSSVVATSGERTVPVSQESYDGTRRVTATPRFAEPVTLTLAAAGRVRSTQCSSGATFTSGTSPVVLDDRPFLALATAQPLWRDLAVGMRGPDVADVQDELARLGYDLDADGVFGPGTRVAVQDLLTQIGVSRPTGVLSAAEVIWLPAAEVTVTACEAGVGDSFAGGALATVGGGLEALDVGGEDSIEGWVVRFGGVTATIGDDRSVTDPSFLETVAASPLLDWATGEGGGTLELEMALAEPVEVTVVPPAAVFGLTADRGCIEGDGEVLPVRVVASALGQTLVEVDGGAAPAVVSLSPDDTSCR